LRASYIRKPHPYIIKITEHLLLNYF